MSEKRDKKDRVLSVRDLNISFETAGGPLHGCRFFVLPASREQEGTESTSEEGQLPQVVEELKDLQVAPGTRLAKFQLKVKGKRERDGGQGAVSCQAMVP